MNDIDRIDKLRKGPVVVEDEPSQKENKARDRTLGRRRMIRRDPIAKENKKKKECCCGKK